MITLKKIKKENFFQSRSSKPFRYTKVKKTDFFSGFLLINVINAKIFHACRKNDYWNVEAIIENMSEMIKRLKENYNNCFDFFPSHKFLTFLYQNFLLFRNRLAFPQRFNHFGYIIIQESFKFFTNNLKYVKKLRYFRNLSNNIRDPSGKKVYFFSFGRDKYGQNNCQQS